MLASGDAGIHVVKEGLDHQANEKIVRTEEAIFRTLDSRELHPSP